MYIKGKLIVAQNDWKDVYASLINFVNEEIEVAHQCALQIYNNSKTENFTSYEQELSCFILSLFQKKIIKKSLYKKDSEKIYKPNKPRKMTNRVSIIDLEDILITVDKVTNTIEFDSCDYDCSLETIIKNNLFIQQFLTMVESINWPTRTGPIKAIRGCKIIYMENNNTVEFYSAGSNPPTIEFDNSIVAKEPTFLTTTQLKSVSKSNNLPLTKEEHYQEIQLVDPELF